MEFLKSDKVPQAIGPYSQAIRVNNMIYTSGQIALMVDGEMVEADIKKQTRQVLTNLKSLLEDCDSDLNSVVKTTIYLANMEDFGIVNVIYAEFFGDHKPARSTVAVKTLPKNALVEIDAVAISRNW
ncbi:MAG: RidA family protein [Arcobacter butzleri]|nr:RidA family protein [Arcobacteraceae bacterium]MDY0364780.1 RidA family protein [Arcobacteraceae bacterium]NLO17706.1 RidA family protein [Aliarcobacter butzleri]